MIKFVFLIWSHITGCHVWPMLLWATAWDWEFSPPSFGYPVGTRVLRARGGMRHVKYQRLSANVFKRNRNTHVYGVGHTPRRQISVVFHCRTDYGRPSPPCFPTSVVQRVRTRTMITRRSPLVPATARRNVQTRILPDIWTLFAGQADRLDATERRVQGDYDDDDEDFVFTAVSGT